MCCLALPAGDVSVQYALKRSFGSTARASFLMLLWEVLCNVLQVYYKGLNNNLYYFFGGGGSLL